MTTPRRRVVQQLGIPIPPRDERDWATSIELVEEAGITYRQCDYWCRTGLLHHLDDLHGAGTTRRFAQDQVERAHLIRVLLEGGMTLPVVRDVIDEIQETGTVQIGVLTISVDQSGDAA